MTESNKAVVKVFAILAILFILYVIWVNLPSHGKPAGNPNDTTVRPENKQTS